MRSFSKIELYKSTIQSMYTEGKSIRAISEKLGLSKSTVGDYIQYLGISRNDFKGKNNPFYGKKHSEQTIAAISKKNTGKQATNKGKCKYTGTEYVNGLLINKWKTEADKRKIEWNISIDDIDTIWRTQGGKCALTGKTMHGRWEGSRYDRASLDRIDSNKGYNKDNCQIVLGIINIMKNTLTNDEFVGWCSSVVEYVNVKS